MNKKEKGKNFEEIAINYLIQNGYEIIGKNIYTPYGEIDIIFFDNDFVVFAEVKGTFYDKFKAYENINEKKRLKILRSGLYYLKNNKLNFYNFRIDAIVITMEGNYFNVHHLTNI